MLGLKIKKSSFIEIDEIDNDDDSEVTYKKKLDKENDREEIKKLTFAEVNSDRVFTNTDKKVHNKRTKRKTNKPSNKRKKFKKNKKIQGKKNIEKKSNHKKKDRSFSKRKNKKNKIKEIERLMYKQKRNKKGDKLRKKKFRLNLIEKLQKNHNVRNGISEGMKGKYSKLMATRGNKYADPLIAYLGFLSDSSLKGNKNILDKQMNKYYG